VHHGYPTPSVAALADHDTTSSNSRAEYRHPKAEMAKDRSHIAAHVEALALIRLEGGSQFHALASVLAAVQYFLSQTAKLLMHYSFISTHIAILCKTLLPFISP
jgi:hypothetical protein